MAEMSVQLQFTLSFDDYKNAQRLHSRRKLLSRFNYFANRVLFPVIGVFSLGTAFLIRADKGAHESVVILVICGLMLCSYPIYRNFQLKRCYDRTRTDNGTCTLDLCPEGIKTATENSLGEIGWKAIRSVNQDDNLFMLYLAPAKFLAIPKRICSPAQIEELSQLFMSQVSPKT